MRLLFWGILFGFANFNINTDTVIIGLLPSFLGFFLMLKAVTGFPIKSEHFTKTKPVLIVVTVLSLIDYALNALGLVGASIAIYALELTITILSYYSLYHVLRGIEEMEAALKIDLESEVLLNLFRVMAFTSILGGLVLFFVPMVGIMLVFATLVVTIVFLMKFNTAVKAYDAYMK